MMPLLLLDIIVFLYVAHFANANGVSLPLVRCQTTKGLITIEVHPEWSPLGAQRFLDLVEDNFYTNIAFFRSVEGFLTQFGISEDVKKKHWHNDIIKDDPNLHLGIKKNRISFAGSGPNSRSTELFIAYEELDFLGNEPWETPFGEVIEGQHTLDSLYKGYGDVPPFGNGPDQQQIYEHGNSYIYKNFPRTDFIKSCKYTNPVPKLAEQQQKQQQPLEPQNAFGKILSPPAPLDSEAVPSTNHNEGSSGAAPSLRGPPADAAAAAAVAAAVGSPSESNGISELTKVMCETTKGPLHVEVHKSWAPLGAERFVELVRDGFYTDIAFYRSVPKFLTQFGISENPAMKHWHRAQIKDDPNLHLGVTKNVMSFAGGGPNTRSTQLFIAYENLDFLGDAPWETPFGKVVGADSQNTLNNLYKGYGDIPPFGKGPDQQKIHNQGNRYIHENFPQTDFLLHCYVVEEESGGTGIPVVPLAPPDHVEQQQQQQQQQQHEPPATEQRLAAPEATKLPPQRVPDPTKLPKHNIDHNRDDSNNNVHRVTSHATGPPIRELTKISLPVAAAVATAAATSPEGNSVPEGVAMEREDGNHQLPHNKNSNNNIIVNNKNNKEKIRENKKVDRNTNTNGMQGSTAASMPRAADDYVALTRQLNLAAAEAAQPKTLEQELQEKEELMLAYKAVGFLLIFIALLWVYMQIFSRRQIMSNSTKAQ